MNAPPLSPPRLDFLDGIRGWAAVMVFFSHMLICLFLPVLPWLANPLTRFASDGKLAVAIFFTLSGFALSHRAARRSIGKSLVTLAIARYLRLVIPIAGVCFIAYMLMLAGLMMNIPAAEITNGADWLASFYRFEPTLESLASFVFFRVFFDYGEPIYNSSLWTMHWEYMGSLLIYGAGWLYVENRPNLYRLFMAGGIVAAIALNLWPMLCFLAGHGLAIFYNHPSFTRVHSKAPQRLVYLLVLIPVMASSLYAPIKNGWVVAALAIMLVTGVTCSPLLQRFFMHPISRFLGRISFPFYLIHLVIICTFGSWLILSLHAQGWSMTQIMLITTASTFVASIGAARLLLPLETFAVRSTSRFATWFEPHLRRITANTV